MEVTIAISLVALIFSAVSIGFAIYSIIRDKGRLQVWSEIYYDSSKDLGNPPPCLKIRIVNAGRRPVVLTSLVKKSSTLIWSSPIVSPNLLTNEKGYLERLPSMQDFSAQNTCLVLQENHVFEFVIEDGSPFDLIASIDDKVHCAEKLYVEDVLKKKYYVKWSKENIKKMRL